MAERVEYNPKYHDNWAWSLAARGCTMQEIADAFKIAKRTLERWSNKHESLKEAITEGRDASNSKVERKLYEIACGYSYTETIKKITMNPDGTPKPVSIETREKKMPPNVGAIVFWLRNREPDFWKDSPEPTKETDNGLVADILEATQQQYLALKEKKNSNIGANKEKIEIVGGNNGTGDKSK